MKCKGATNTTVAEMRRVWAALTRDPQISYRELSRMSGLSLARVRAAIARLQGLGYVEHGYRQERAMRVLVPFVEVRHAD